MATLMPGWALPSALGQAPLLHALALAAALALTLVLAAFFTPARWWRRPNLGALAVLVLGTWGIASALFALLPQPALAQGPQRAGMVSTAAAAPVTAAVTAPVKAAPAAAALPPAASFVVFHDLNLRASPGIHAPRLALVPAGARLVASGRREGDWWQVRASLHGRASVEGWVSSLWLRQAGELHARAQAADR